MTLIKWDFPPESGNDDTYVFHGGLVCDLLSRLDMALSNTLRSSSNSVSCSEIKVFSSCIIKQNKVKQKVPFNGIYS